MNSVIRASITIAVIFIIGCSAQKSSQQTVSKDTPVAAANSADQKLVPQKTCPVMGNPINKDLFVDVDGKRIYVCCGGCIDPIKKDPQLYIEKLKEMGESVESVVSGN